MKNENILTKGFYLDIYKTLVNIITKVSPFLEFFATGQRTFSQ